MLTIVTKTIPTDELTEYKDYINFLFRNESGVYNICTTEEDIIKSNQWFKNFPLITYVVSDAPIEIGDKFLAVATNGSLNGNIFTYMGLNEEGVDLIKILGADDRISISTIHLMKNSKRFERMATIEDKKKIVDGQTKMIKLDK